jgi:hypothetical protein
MGILENAEVKLSALWGETGDKVYRKFQAVRKIIDGEDTDPLEDICTGKFHLLKFAPVTSCDVERSIKGL